jgi:hypothetical protein
VKSEKNKGGGWQKGEKEAGLKRTECRMGKTKKEK